MSDHVLAALQSGDPGVKGAKWHGNSGEVTCTLEWLREQISAAEQRGYEKAVQEDIEREKVALRHFVEAPVEGFDW